MRRWQSWHPGSIGRKGAHTAWRMLSPSLDPVQWSRKASEGKLGLTEEQGSPELLPQPKASPAQDGRTAQEALLPARLCP